MKQRVKAITRDDANDVSSSSSSELAFQTSYQGTPIDELADQLTAIGFDGARDLILKYGYDRVSAAKARAESRPAGAIRNLAGYIRFLVTSKGAIPDPDPDRRKEYQELIAKQNAEYDRLHPGSKHAPGKGGI